jgi:cell division protein FtsB
VEIPQTTSELRPRRPRPRPGPARRRLALAAVALVVAFVLGLVFGDALAQRPRRAQVTVDRRVAVVTVTETVAQATRTLVVPATSP